MGSDRAREVSSCLLVENRTISPMTKLEKPIFIKLLGVNFPARRAGVKKWGHYHRRH